MLFVLACILSLVVLGSVAFIGAAMILVEIERYRAWPRVPQARIAARKRAQGSAVATKMSQL